MNLNNAPKLRFPEFSSNWEINSFAHFFERVQRKNIENNKNVLTISGEKGLISQNKYFNKNVSSSDVTGYYLLHKDEFAYNKSYSNGYPLGAIKRLKRYENGVLSTLYICFKSVDNEEASYFEHYFKSGKINKELHKICQEGARNHGLLNLSVTEFFNDIKISISADIEERQKIALFFSSIEEWLEMLESQCLLIKQYKLGLVDRIFNNDFRFKHTDEKSYTNWTYVKLADVLTERSEKNSKDYKEVFSVAKEKGVINQIKHLGRRYAADDLSKYKVIRPYDIAYTKSPTSGFPFGIIKQNRTQRTGVISTLYGVFIPKSQYIGYLLHEYFNSSVKTYNYLVPLVHKGAKNTLNISNSDFLNGAKIPIPTSTEEQKKIVSVLSLLDELIEIKRNQIQKVKIWEKGLLQQMFV